MWKRQALALAAFWLVVVGIVIILTIPFVDLGIEYFPIYFFIGIPWFALLFFLGLRATVNTFNAKLPDIEQLKHRYVLFLRPFGADFRGSFEGHLGNEMSRRGQQLISLQNQALMSPFLRSSAVKVPAGKSDWQPIVSELARRVRFLLFQAGLSEALRWELDLIRHRCDPSRTFLLIAVDPESEVADWHQIDCDLRLAGFQTSFTGNPGQGSVLAFDKAFRARILVQGCKEEGQMVDAILRCVEQIEMSQDPDLTTIDPKDGFLTEDERPSRPSLPPAPGILAGLPPLWPSMLGGLVLAFAIVIIVRGCAQ
jgi:hypothetical protein